MFIQLDGQTYWLYTKIKRFASHRFLQNCFFGKVECFSLVWLFGFYSPLVLVRALTGCTCDNLIHAAPAQK